VGKQSEDTKKVETCTFIKTILEPLCRKKLFLVPILRDKDIERKAHMAVQAAPLHPW